MIKGVKTKRLKSIVDERGFLMEMLRSDDNIYESFGQVYMTSCKSGIAKAWHYHKKQTDHLVCVMGKVLLALYDQRKGSETYGMVADFILTAPNPVPGRSDREGYHLVKVPPMVVHGFTPLDCDEARIVNIPTLPYNYSNPDEHRFAWDSGEIPFKWPDNVKQGG